jgi:acetyl esterase/lipase
MTPSQRNAETTLVLNRHALEGGIAAYVQSDLDQKHPDLSPLYADLSDMPPALFSVGTLDPLLDDTLFMHGRWMAAGRETQLALYPGGVHGFNTFDGTLARQANAAIDAFIARHV